MSGKFYTMDSSENTHKTPIDRKYRESNSHSFALTPHPCTDNNYHVCETDNCGGTYSDDRFAGNCDANGCDYNPYRMGVTDFYGKGKTVDTSKKFT